MSFINRFPLPISAKWRYLVQQLLRSMQQIAYPPFCMHCSEPLEDPVRVLCDACVQQMPLLQKEGRCCFCFDDVETSGHRVCSTCLEYPVAWRAGGACCDYSGPAQTLVKRLKYGGVRYLSSGMSAYLYTQWEALKWPLPDVLVPVPSPWLRRFSRGYNHSFLLAEGLSRLLQVPVVEALSRKSGDFPQAGLDQEQRQQLHRSSFQLRKRSAVTDKSVLLIDDVCTTGSTLRACADVLLEGYPSELYVIVFARAQ